MRPRLSWSSGEQSSAVCAAWTDWRAQGAREGDDALEKRGARTIAGDRDRLEGAGNSMIENEGRPRALLHVSVCVATFRRPAMLDGCLLALQDQNPGPFTYSIVIVDNDAAESARDVVEAWQRRASIPISYDVERVPNISGARNRALRNATGDLVAFIDDDEFPDPAWLSNLVAAYSSSSADGVLGPVVPSYEGEPPSWLVASGLCTRKSFPTGTPLQSATDMRSGNVLFGRQVIEHDESPFDPRFGCSGGEDSDFFERKLAEGRTFVWCDEARVWERVPAHRQNLGYFIKRAVVLGSTAARREELFSFGTLRSVVAVVAYTVSLPVLPIFGYHRFVRVFIKDCNHGAKLLAHLGFRLLHERPM